jgi:hypothetical protein
LGAPAFGPTGIDTGSAPVYPAVKEADDMAAGSR